MNNTAELNLSDVDILVKDFLSTYDKGIRTIYKVHCPGSDQLALSSFIADIMDELRTGCVTFINNNDVLDGLYSYLFYIVNARAKKVAHQNYKKMTQYVCPGCAYLGKTNIITLAGSVFKCNECLAESKDTQDPKQLVLFKTFYLHNKSGYKCPDCNRFIPRPIYGSTKSVSCPYFECCFVGDIDSLKKMHHPSSHSNPEKLLADLSCFQQTAQENVVSVMEAKQDLANKVKILTGVIESQTISTPYSGSNFTLMHKLLTYQAFRNLIQKFPEEMIEYLVNIS